MFDAKVPAWIQFSLSSESPPESQAATIESIRTALTLTDKRAEFAYRKFKKNKWLKRKNRDAYDKQLALLEADVHKCLLQKIGIDTYRTYAGLLPELRPFLNEPLQSRIVYPEPKSLPWAVKPFSLRPYQQEIVDALLDARHGAVSVATALGKSRCLLELCRKIGRQAVVMAPTKSIARQLFEDFQKHLGKKVVGLYGDGRKDLGKTVTVAIAASLAQIDHGSPAWAFFSQTVLLAVDESHLVAAKTLEATSCGLFQEAPYRCFVSGTQMRQDGLDMLLRGIIGPVVYTMSVRDGVDQGWLARPVFHLLEVPAEDDFVSEDINEMTRHHFFYNRGVAEKAIEIAALGIELGRPVLILIEDIGQYGWLRECGLDDLPCRRAFAHGTLDETNCSGVEEWHQSDDSAEAVRQFNDGEVPLLIGSSAVSIGTDVRPAQILIRLKAGRSEVDVRQDVGRGLRKPPGKEDCWVFDFVVDQEDMRRHAEIRAEIYADIYGPILWG